jgi:transposase
VETVYEWIWVYVAIDPLTGRCWSLLLPSMQGEALQVFLEYLHLVFGKQRVGVVLDNAPSHISGQVQWPDGIEPLYLPPYSPELDPAEQLFRRFRAMLSNQRFAHQEGLEAALIAALEVVWDDPASVRQLTAYPWWCNAFPSNDIMISPD